MKKKVEEEEDEWLEQRNIETHACHFISVQ